MRTIFASLAFLAFASASFGAQDVLPNPTAPGNLGSTNNPFPLAFVGTLKATGEVFSAGQKVATTGELATAISAVPTNGQVTIFTDAAVGYAAKAGTTNTIGTNTDNLITEGQNGKTLVNLTVTNTSPTGGLNLFGMFWLNGVWHSNVVDRTELDGTNSAIAANIAAKMPTNGSIDHTTGMTAEMTASTNALWNELTQTNGAILNGRFYESIRAANEASHPGDKIRVLGSVTVTNKIILTNIFLDCAGATITGLYTNDTAGISSQFVPYAGTKICGPGTIRTPYTNRTMSPIGFDDRVGDPTCTNFLIKNMLLAGESDCLYWHSTNGGACGQIISCVLTSSYDTVVSAFLGSGVMTYRDCEFSTDGSYPGGVGRPLILANGTSEFYGCKVTTLNYSASGFGNSLKVGSGTGVSTSVPGTNSFYGTKFVGISTNATVYPVIEIAGGTGSNSPVDRFVNCSVEGSNTFGLLIGKSTVYLQNCSIFPGTSSIQFSNNNASAVVYYSGGNVTSNRFSAATGTATHEGD